MITSTIPPCSADVARHYDELDEFYREVWGDHVHHGYWEKDQDDGNIAEATLLLLKNVTSTLSLEPGNQILDIGSGYGASSRWIAARHSAHLTAITLSERQAIQARLATAPERGTAEYHVEDWLENTLPDGLFDAAIAIESLAHMPDKRRFFEQVHRTLKPGGQAALAVWTTAEDLNWLEQRLLEKICEEGRLPSMGTLQDYIHLAKDCGFTITQSTDITTKVERTWWIIARRVLRGAFTNPSYLRFILSRAFRKRIFVLTLPRLLLAYRTGAMRYGLLTITKPQ